MMTRARPFVPNMARVLLTQKFYDHRQTFATRAAESNGDEFPAGGHYTLSFYIKYSKPVPTTTRRGVHRCQQLYHIRLEKVSAMILGCPASSAM